MTARTDASANSGELLWLEHPQGGVGQTPWQEHVIGKGPDVVIEQVEAKGYEDYIVLYCAEFFSKTLSVITVHKKTH